MSIIITGSAGFIGFHLSKTLLKQGEIVIGVDNLNDYYEISLKETRLAILKEFDNFIFYRGDIADQQITKQITQNHQDSNYLIHLAAQAGVRYSITNPHVYGDSNLQGQINILEMARNLPNLKQFIFASSSSVYGKDATSPFSIEQKISTPISLYAATKVAGEAMAYSYSHLYNIPTVILRFFTVYGPYGRPDMAIYLFTKALFENSPIKLFNHGKLRRDFTYIDDIIQGITKALQPSLKQAGCEIYNLGNNKTVELKYFLELLEKSTGKKANVTYHDMQAGDMLETCADISKSVSELDYSPNTPIELGIPKFVDWYKNYYKL